MSRLVISQGRYSRHAATTAAALQLIDHARAIGFRSTKLLQSRVPGSPSRYVVAVDLLGRDWHVRVSDHPRPADAKTPHHDLLVGRNGATDLDPALRFLSRVASGEERWFDCYATGRTIAPKTRKLWRRR